jgi:hypothetical protein
MTTRTRVVSVVDALVLWRAASAHKASVLFSHCTGELIWHLSVFMNAC